MTQLDERGRTIARADADDVWSQTCHQAAMLYEGGAQLHVIPLFHKIAREHAVDLADFEFIAQVSPFVPADREALFARGLYEGFKVDFALALHLLLPQLEHAIRITLRAIAASDERLQAACADVLADPEQPTLAQALHEPWATELATFIGDGGEDVVSALRILLLERFGGNLRNSVLHGLTAYNGAHSWRGCYSWWLILKICCATAVRAARESGGIQLESV